MIARFFHADSDVTAALSRAVASMPKLLLVTHLSGPRNGAYDQKTPFKEVLACAGAQLDIVLVIDEGLPEGMWRDPMGVLCDSLYPGDAKTAQAAKAGYVLVQGGQPLAWYRKALWDPFEDAETLTYAISQVIPGVVPFARPKPEGEVKPPPRKPPTAEEAAAASRQSASKRRDTPVINQAAAKPGAGKRRETPIINPAAGGKRCDTPIINPAASANSAKNRPPRRDTPPMSPEAAYAPTQEIPKVEVPPPAPPPPPEPPPLDPFAILGVAPGVGFDEVKKAYRALILQYHPDKVAHLGKEFRELAEKKTLDLNAAYQMLEKTLRK